MRKLAVYLMVMLTASLCFYLYSTQLKYDQGNPVRDISSASESSLSQKGQLSEPEKKAEPPGSGSRVNDSPEIYDILGKSDRLSPKQLLEMKNWRADIVRFAKDNPGQVYINGFTKEKKVCLTFDDGPDSEITPEIIDILNQYQVTASFFFKGSRLEENRDVVKKAYDSGCLVLSHAWSHSELTLKTPQQIKNELLLTEGKMFEIIGKRPALVRPPFGDIDEKVAQAIKDNGSRTVLWSIDTLDWSQKEKENIVNNVINNVRPGDIILMHSDEDKNVTADSLPAIITELRKRGYVFVDLGEMLGVNPYK